MGAADAVPATTSRSARQRRVLVVDDNVDATDSLVMLLQLMGHDVRAVHSGSEALDVLGRESFEIVLMDIGMPQMDGHTAARQLRERLGPRTPQLVAITGWGQPADRARSAAAGFDHHLTKPADPLVLARLIEAAP